MVLLNNLVENEIKKDPERSHMYSHTHSISSDALNVPSLNQNATPCDPVR